MPNLINKNAPINQHKRLAMGEKINAIGKTADEELTETDKGEAEEKAEANQ